MTIAQLEPEQIDALVGTRHGVTGIEYPSEGLQPYYQWLVRTLHLLAESSAGALRVARDESSPTRVHVAPGRASIDDVAVAHDGGSIDLASHNNDTALVWLAEDEGAAVVDAAGQNDGWPTDPHVKLAEVTLEAGAITAIVDRRFETIFRA